MINLRQSKPADAEQIANVIRQSVEQLCIADHQGEQAVLNSWLENKTPETITAWVNAKDSYCVSALDDSATVVGFGMLSQTGEVKLLYVSPEQKGTGVGQALLQNMEGQAVDWHLTEISLDSTKAAKTFYERQGYSYRGACGERSDGLSCLSMLKRIAA